MSFDSASSESLIIVCNDEKKTAMAQSLQQQMAAKGEQINSYNNVDVGQFTAETIALVIDERGVYLQQCGPNAPGLVRADFVGGAIGYRRHQPREGANLLAKAIGIGGGRRPSVLDTNAGLGQDAFIIASLGCRVTAVERHPLIFALLADGIARAENVANEGDEQLCAILDNLSIVQQDSLQLLSNLGASQQPDVIFLDPMFPPRSKSAKVNKTMQLFHCVVGRDGDADKLLQKALEVVRYRVVVKRPRLADPLTGKSPPLQFSGRAVRFDVYPKRKMQK